MKHGEQCRRSGVEQTTGLIRGTRRQSKSFGPFLDAKGGQRTVILGFKALTSLASPFASPWPGVYVLGLPCDFLGLVLFKFGSPVSRAAAGTLGGAEKIQNLQQLGG